MIIRRTHKFRVYPTAEQEARLLRWQDALRFLWNLANEQRLMGLARSQGEKVYPSAFSQGRETTLLRAELDWLADVPRSACAAALSRLQTAWERCFTRLSRAPRWKRKGEGVTVSETHSNKWHIDAAGMLRFPKLGPMRIITHRPTEGRRRSCSIVRDGDQWFACIVYEVDAPDPAPRTAPVVALDRGITYTLADSDGNLTPNPKHYDKAMKRLAHAQRVVSRRKKGSKNREKAKLRVMRLHRKVRHQREHFLHVESARLAKSHGVVVIEKLNVKGMMGGNCARGIAGAGWSSFANMLAYKLAWSGGSLVEVPARYSSQTCSACGAVNAASRRGERFCCIVCGHRDHADLNAAKVLLSRASRSALPAEVNMPKVSL